MSTQTIPLPAAKRKSRDQRKILILISAGAAVGALAGYGIGGILKSAGTKYHPEWWTLLFLPITALLALALHEAGHVAGGWISGFRFYMYVVGPLRIQRDGNRLKFMFNPVRALWGGLAACAPQRLDSNLRGHMLNYTAGGPLFSWLGATALLPAMAARQTNENLSFILLEFGLLSALIGITTLIPMQLSGFNSDGARLWMLLRNQPEGRRWTALAAVAGLAMAERPKHWPAELLEMLGEGLDPAPDSVFTCLLRHHWHLDRGEWAAAGLWLDRGVANIDSLAQATRGGLLMAAAYFEARHRGNTALAREYFELASKPGLHNREDQHITSAAVLIAEGRRQEAHAELELAKRALESKPAPVATALREDIENLRAAIA